MASLFPGSPQLEVTRPARDAAARPASSPFVDRVTMTVPTIHGGAADRLPRRRARTRPTPSHEHFGGDITEDVPASLTRLAPVPVEVFLDAAAAATNWTAVSTPESRSHEPRTSSSSSGPSS